MTDHFESYIIKAISETMTCNKCPYPCKAKSNSSMYNCVKQWCYILSKIDPNVDWNEVVDGICATRTTEKYSWENNNERAN